METLLPLKEMWAYEEALRNAYSVAQQGELFPFVQICHPVGHQRVHDCREHTVSWNHNTHAGGGTLLFSLQGRQ